MVQVSSTSVQMLFNLGLGRFLFLLHETQMNFLDLLWFIQLTENVVVVNFSVFSFLIFFVPNTMIWPKYISWWFLGITKISLLSVRKQPKVSSSRQFSWCFMALRGIWKALEELIDKILSKIYIENPNVLNTQKCTHNIPQSSHDIPQCPHDIPGWGGWLPNRCTCRYGGWLPNRCTCRYGCVVSAKARLGKISPKNLMPGQKSAQNLMTGKFSWSLECQNWIFSSS